MKKDKSLATALLGSALIVAATAFMASAAHAGPPQPSKADYKHLAHITANQALIEKAKGWNAAEIDALHKDGWDVQWSDLKLIPFTQPQ